MIHRHIFVHARPGMSEQELFSYWKDVHAERYGKKIPQVRGYLINSHVPFGSDETADLFQGTAEVWIEHVEDALAFAQSKEYLEGSRVDEPNFLAWWQMVVLDTTDHEILAAPPRDVAWPGVKMIVVVKRKPGLSLEELRRYSVEAHGPKVAMLPGLRGYVQCHVNDAHYALGESPLDSVSLLWFESTDAIVAAMQSAVFRDEIEPDMARFVDPRYFRYLVTEEYWVVPLGSAVGSRS
jgi:uncharacterized protein (TIGR02118 family)